MTTQLKLAIGEAVLNQIEKSGRKPEDYSVGRTTKTGYIVLVPKTSGELLRIKITRSYTKMTK